MNDTEAFIEYLNSGEIPPGPPRGTSPYGCAYNTDWPSRSEAIARGMWAVVDKVWTKKLADWIGNRTCLEVMAGAGWLAKALSDYGVDIVATDNGEWDERHNKMVIVHEIEKISGIKAVKKYSDREVLIVSWPPYEEKTICKICEQWGKTKPIVYIGEDNGGCNAPDEFFDCFCPIDPQPDIPLMAWSGLHDYVSIGYYSARNSAPMKG